MIICQLLWVLMEIANYYTKGATLMEGLKTSLRKPTEQKHIQWQCHDYKLLIIISDYLQAKPYD